MLKKIILVYLLVISFTFIFAEDYNIVSPDGKINVSISVENKICYSVFYSGVCVVDNSSIYFTFSLSPPLGRDMEVLKHDNYSKEQVWTPVLKRYDKITDRHWWSGDVKMEQPVIYEYIDLASEMGWTYMLIDWQWYLEEDLLPGWNR
jgi:hypothetical protein